MTWRLISTENLLREVSRTRAGITFVPERGTRLMTDIVNKPPHYQLREGYEVYDLRQDLARKTEEIGVPNDWFSDWDRALEYLLRMWEKNELEDAKKSRWYLNKLIEKLEGHDIEEYRRDAVSAYETKIWNL